MLFIKAQTVAVPAPSPPLEDSQTTTASDTSYKAPSAEITRRKNFAIISHPDAGKTTLTEKLLLFGGAIQDAGAVKARADQRKATSDWMEIEKQRGISVTSTVLSFEYAFNKDKFHINLLDTPGHEDFSEDTYRTLAAADNVVMLIDAAKGIEDRTRKLFDVCKLRRLPIFTFVNKLDRPSQSPLDLIDQIEKEFMLEACPMNWPIGDGDDFQGVFDRASREVHLFTRGNRRKKITSQTVPLGADLQEEIGDTLYKQLLEDIELLDNVLPLPDIPKIIEGRQSPLFFGSAMTSFGVELFLRTFLQYARSPVQREALLLSIGSAASGSGGEQIANAPFTTPSSPSKPSSSSSAALSAISPDYSEFTGFVFKLQANLDPRHRDRLAFIRIVSGSYRKGMKVQHSRLRKTINLSQAQSLFAQERESVAEAFPGDVIGLHNPGHFAIGDTIFTGNRRVVFPPLPSFSPEKFAYIKNPNPSAYKKFQKGLSQLLDEGAVQILRDRGGGNDAYPLLAAVGGLQLEVVVYRLEHEYNSPCSLEYLSTYSLARWVGGGWDAVDKAEEEGRLVGGRVVEDQWGRPVLLLRNSWKLNSLQDEAAYLDLQPYALPPSEF